MESLIEKSKKYLDETLGIDIPIAPWKEKKKLPLFLSDTYIFFESSILSVPCLFMISKDMPSPNTLKKHWEFVTRTWDVLCVYVFETSSSYERKRLLQSHIPFIVPGNQIFLPDLGLNLTEYFKQKRKRKQLFSPATQAAILALLTGEKKERFTPSELAVTLGYSSMTMTRVFDELETNDIGKLIHTGRERWWIFKNGKKDLWEQTNSFLRSPIKRREYIKLLPGKKTLKLPLASISALAEVTMLAPPHLPAYAIGLEDYQQTDTPKGFFLSPEDEADFELQIWYYNPKLFSKDGSVDPFSLYLSLRDEKDERVEAALEELMENIKW